VLTAIPKSWFSWDFTVADQGRPIADIGVSWWREKGRISGPFVLENHDGVVARAIIRWQRDHNAAASSG
jgi:hypothetical protein